MEFLHLLLLLILKLRWVIEVMVVTIILFVYKQKIAEV